MSERDLNPPAVDAALVERQFARTREAAVAELRAEGFAGEPEIAYAIAMRYLGQNYEHEVPIPAAAVTADGLDAAFAAFGRVHAERYGYQIEGEVIELVSFRVVASGRRPAPRLVAAHDPAEAVPRPARAVRFHGHGEVTAAVHRRYGLAPGTRLAGPCVVEEAGSTTVVEPGMAAAVLPDGQLLIEVNP